MRGSGHRPAFPATPASPLAGTGSSSSPNSNSTSNSSSASSPPSSPRGRICLGLTVDAATLSHSLKYGFLLHDRHQNGRVIFSLKELEPGQVYWTENNNEIKRINEHQVLLGGTETLPIPEEEDFDPNAGILVFQDEKPLLLADAGKEVFAEAHIERTTGEKFYRGIPLASGTDGTGMVAFSLHQLPVGCEFVYHATVKGRAPVRIRRVNDKTCQIDGKSYAMADVKQVLPSDSSLLDLAFPSSPTFRQRRGTVCAPVQLPPISPRERSYSVAVPSSPRRSAPNCPFEPDVIEMEDIDGIDTETITREKMKEFDERLLDATRRRESEKRAKLTEMMRKYAVPTLDFEGTSAKEADGEADTEESDSSDVGRDESEDTVGSPELSNSDASNSSGPVVVVEVLEEIDPPAPHIEPERSHEDLSSASEDVRSGEERGIVDNEVSGHTASEEVTSEAGEKVAFDEEELEEVALNDSPEVNKSKNGTDRGGEATGREEAVIPEFRGTEKVEELDQEQEPQENLAKAKGSQLPHGTKPGNARSRAGGLGRGRGRGQARAGHKAQRRGKGK